MALHQMSSQMMTAIDDITRPTPCEPIAKAVIAELRAAGVPKENIWFIIALGTHGVMYRTEFVRKLGEEIVENYEVHNHNLFFNHVFVGNTSNNVPVEINADVMSADYKIAIGTTMAHSYYGFSGGAKCILPGVSSLRTIMRNHSFTTTTEFNMGNPHTLMRSDAEQAARMMGLDFKIDAILNGHAQICNLFAGDFEAEIQHAAAYAAEHSGAEYVKTWNDALRILDDGTPKKVVLYPNAECQVLDNSKQFYKQGK